MCTPVPDPSHSMGITLLSSVTSDLVSDHVSDERVPWAVSSGKSKRGPRSMLRWKATNTSLRWGTVGPASPLNPPLGLDRGGTEPQPHSVSCPMPKVPVSPAAQPTGDPLMVPELPEDVCAAAAGQAVTGDQGPRPTRAVAERCPARLPPELCAVTLHALLVEPAPGRAPCRHQAP